MGHESLRKSTSPGDAPSTGTESRGRDVLFIGLLVAVSSALILTNLENSYLWEDEAATALISSTILTHGIPMGRDDTNSFSHEMGRDMTAGGVFVWQPWVPYYIVAASFAVFGESPVSARGPFALFGIATIVMTYYLGLELWRERRSARLGAITLMLSVPFLLQTNQCRYYTLSAFLTALGLWAYLRVLEGRRWAAVIFVICAQISLHTNHGFSIAFLLGVFAHCLLWRRDRAKLVFALCAGIGLLNLPWIAWMSSFEYGPTGLLKTLRFVVTYLVELFLCAPHPIFAIAGLVLMVASRMRRKRGGSSFAGPMLARRVGLLALIAAATIVLVSIPAREPYFRYLSPLLPLGSVLAGWILSASWRLNKVWAGAIVAIWLGLGQFPWYVYELTHEYDGPIEGMVRFLEDAAAPDDVVAISYGDLPLKFYTDLRIVGGYTGEDFALAHEADWVVPRTYQHEELRGYLLEMVDRGGYERIALDGYPDVPWENRESPFAHRFRTANGADPVIIYHRLREN